MFVLSLIPVFIQLNDGEVVKVIWSALMFLTGTCFLLGAIDHMQYYYFDNGYIVVKSLLGIVAKLDIEKTRVSIEILPTYYSWVTTVNEKWICIYDESIANNVLNKFKTGCSNSKKHRRIQIICNQKNKQKLIHIVRGRKKAFACLDDCLYNNVFVQM